jgi:Raf kinase inhibitor-like YbhB/YbcL family protein
VSFTLSSPSFTNGAAIPAQHTCDGADRSPNLTWTGIPAGTRSLALLVDDPDAPAGTWVHWVLFNLPAGTNGLPENVSRTETLPELGGAIQGRNDSRTTGYAGPCPPPGKPHRYYFKLYALDGELSLRSGATKADVERGMEGHVLGNAQLMGTYGRNR